MRKQLERATRVLHWMMMPIVTIAIALPALASYDFTAQLPSGQTAYFKIEAGSAVLTYPNNSVFPTEGWNGFTKPTGQIIIPSTITHEGTSYNIAAVGNHAFYGCVGVTTVIVQAGVHALRQNAFNGCQALTSISLPATIDTVAAAALANCTALQTITMLGITPPSFTGSAFTNLTPSEIDLVVPCGSAEAYSNAAYWSSFTTIIESNCQASLTVYANYPQRGTTGGSGTYPTGSVITLTALPADGYFFACWHDGDTNNPRTIVLDHEAYYTALFFAIQHDTITPPERRDTILIHDTVTSVVVHVDTVHEIATDTVTQILIVSDTVVQEVHDTLTLYVGGTDTIIVVQHDTVHHYLAGADTIYLTQTDTLTVHDTILPTYFRLSVSAMSGGIGIGNAILPAGTVAEIGALPLSGYVFSRWDDGNTDNPRTVHLTGNLNYTALFEAATVGAAQPSAPTWDAHCEGLLLCVRCAAGTEIHVYSADGRQLAQATATAAETRLLLPAAGVYLVQADGGGARKITAR